MKKIILLLSLILCTTLPSAARPFDGFARTPFFEEQLKGVEKRLGLVFPKENREYYKEGEFKKKFFGLPGWVLIEEKSKREYYALYSSRLNKTILLYIYWTKSADETRLTFLDLLLETYPAWFEIEKDYELADLGDYGVISKSKDRAYFACGNVCVAVDVERRRPVPFSAFSELAESLSALLRGEAEFLPEDTPEFVEIRKPCTLFRVLAVFKTKIQCPIPSIFKGFRVRDFNIVVNSVGLRLLYFGVSSPDTELRRERSVITHTRFIFSKKRTYRFRRELFPCVRIVHSGGNAFRF